MRRTIPRHGFTLIELLVVTAILGVLIAAIAACLFGGIRVWETARRFNVVEADAALALRIFQKDLVNTFLFAGIPFKGQAGEVTFPCLSVQAGMRGELEGSGRIAAARYHLDEARGLLRATQFYEANNEMGRPQEEKLLSGPLELRLQYYAFPQGAESAAGAWQETWDSATNLPGAVRVDLAFADGGRVSRTIVLPIAKP
jgi:prepilin-type N-terminal cleavage/methylation domain-containing protein